MGSCMVRFWSKTFFHQLKHCWWNVDGSSSMTMTPNTHVKVQEGPSQSLNLNPIENLWRELKFCVVQQQQILTKVLQTTIIDQILNFCTIKQIHSLKVMPWDFQCIYEEHYRPLIFLGGKMGRISDRQVLLWHAVTAI